MEESVKLIGKNKFTPEYKKEIIKMVTERRKKTSEVAKDIGVTSTSIRRWIKQYSKYGKYVFPGKSNLRPEEEKIRKLIRENIDLKEENEILKKAMAIWSWRREMICKFIKKYRSAFRVVKMCQVLEVSRRSYYNWLKRPVSAHQKEDKIPIEKIRRIQKESYRINSNHCLPVAPNLLD